MPKKLLKNINFPSDIRKLSADKLPLLATELREFIIDVVATKEGHLGASLGVVELTIALHYVFDTPTDQFVWDVGHQAYGHKILTGRKDVFHSNRQLGGISGFPKRSESAYDTFGVGHSSTSISAALGMAIASKIQGSNKHHIAIIGDASIASGMAFEALNHAGDTDANLLVILNDNAIGIDPSVGALKGYLTRIKSTRSDIEQHNIFEALNFEYSGPIDGHNFEELLSELNRLKEVKGPKFLHIITTKGKGLRQAEQDQVKYHAPGKFDKISGDVLPKKKSKFTKFQDVFGKTLIELAHQNKKIVGITPAMLSGSSLNEMLAEFPERTFDVGIAEQHAVTLSAGMATQNIMPFCAIYSTFLQRSFDQIIHDVALQNLPVIFCIDRAGLVGQDGATHHGVFDLAYLRLIPNIIIFAPRNEIELRNIMFTAQLGLKNPIAIRYPRGTGQLEKWQLPFEEIQIGKAVCLHKLNNHLEKSSKKSFEKLKNKVAILSVGTIANTVFEAINKLENSNNVAHYDMRFVKPLDKKLLAAIFTDFDSIITLEDGTVSGGFGSAILEYASEENYQGSIDILGIPDEFIDHGTVEELKVLLNIDTKSIQEKIEELLESV
ncbi:1-deoxy-D-xylulose-5-phosphate synthase [Tenacibaculum finnmarkense]|uniref:1-deoxy-D-xylulose-5-phosphate synthase n=1 Tax=Tenacibaculum finnmarkense TaxID=2781243 RepID=UPI001EFA9C10|nr:1-deoxy-D-xylulose-5-phosphate synthase [Tenacibaculum finnmarkense]MCG8205873.1 1-deoxy-D-xylulose-5-phosphate synthase [Tenacibaculum finnmarkense genomovar finnmarkense]MCG8722056.1 1-deoxy-D-xylulose-5-phosphate synthase [Tenacibaculum finnmarkense]MCG8740256.1 1-deoxy-D-xylulose-5-phosphate synthase [Tenacibaculum finnmarkense]MCG8763590.1 1-deoxy-D-xylulose-5-phosphate synthase [Tenacibaculum finnmarkense]MCG8776823.1 1-deoxy-D-xylulose-5-phosphate synthase [Tenacibaculum finnmarkense